MYVCVCIQGYRVCTNTNVLMASHELCCCSSSVSQSCLTLCNPMNCSTPGLPALHYLLEFAHTHVHRVDDSIQPSHPLSPPSPSCPQSFPASGSFPMSQIFTSGDQRIGASASASVLPVNIQGCLSPEPGFQECPAELHGKGQAGLGWPGIDPCPPRGHSVTPGETQWFHDLVSLLFVEGRWATVHGVAERQTRLSD